MVQGLEGRFTLLTGDGEGVPAIWRSESGDPPPERATPVDERLNAATALRRAQQGEYLLYQGDYRNAQQLLAAMGRRLASKRRGPTRSPLEIFRQERLAREREHRILSRLVVTVDDAYRLSLPRAPDVRDACRAVWGDPNGSITLVPLKTLWGMMGAAEWYRKGLEVPGLQGRIHPHYGVFVPTRHDYVDLLVAAPRPQGKRAFDIGTGTGVLSFLLLQRGASSVLATDVEPRAVACARENATRLNLADRFQAIECDLFPEGSADLVVCNPPWLPEPPKNRLDRAIFDPDQRFLRAFLEGLAGHLLPGGQGYLFLSNLAELLGLRPAHFLSELLDRSGLEVIWKQSAPARHPKAQDEADPLHDVRSREISSLYCLAPKRAPPAAPPPDAASGRPPV
jgi:SAM-dependent methyltransferase